MPTKRQREQKRRERRESQELARQRNPGQQRGSTWAKLKPWEPVKMRLYEAPSLLPDSLNREEGIAIIQQAAQQAEDTFRHEYFQLNEWFRKYDALDLLSYCSLYFLAHPEGVDPEANGPLDFYAYYLEILQAFSLMQDRSFLSRPLGPEVGDLLDTMGKIGDAIQFRRFRDLADLGESEVRQHFLLGRMRDQTTALRNWGCAPHMHKVVHALAHEIQTEFVEFYDFDLDRLADTLLKLAEIAQDRVGQHLRRVRHFFQQRSYQDVVKAYSESFPDESDLNANQLFDLVGRHLDSMKA